MYNYFHVGNARPFIIFDLLRRYFEYRGYKVEFVQNFTDIDDKVINKANEEGVDFNTIAERYIRNTLLTHRVWASKRRPCTRVQPRPWTLLSILLSA